MFSRVTTGDPLSPLLFVLGAGFLTQIFSKAQREEVIDGFYVAKDYSGIPILQYVNNTLAFVDGSVH